MGGSHVIHSEIARAITLLHPPGAVMELRALDVSSRSGRRDTYSGYYTDPAKAAADAAELNGRAVGIYVTMNEIKPALLARAVNRCRAVGKDPTTADHDAIRRRWLLIDFDAVPVKGISATDTEVAAAIDRSNEVREYLTELDWPLPLACGSGNGAHLLYRIDEPTDDGGLVKAVLVGLSNRFPANEAGVKIDTSVHNPARITKLYGTLACKGESTRDRPHRLSRILSPADLVAMPVSTEQLELVAGLGKQKAEDESWNIRLGGSREFDLGDWVGRHLPDARQSSWENSRRRWSIPVCPFNSDHSRGEAWVGERASGAMVAGCRHDSCNWGWRDLRERLEPGCYDRKDTGTTRPPVNGHNAHNGHKAHPAAWIHRADLVQRIRSRAREPWLSLGLDSGEIVSVRAGSIVTLSGPTGAGKTSLASGIAIRHAAESGTSLVLSRELTADEMAARMIGMQTDQGWADVLKGSLSDDEMLAALPERLVIIDRTGATLQELAAELARIRALDPMVAILVIVDYGQIVGANSEDQRARVSATWEGADELARTHRVVVLMLSQMSRANARAARSGERLGADALDGGAESAAIERYSTVVLELGQYSEPDEQGHREVNLSIAKGRMSGGDVVIPMRYHGKTGRWTVVGASKPAAEVRARAAEGRTEDRITAAIDRMVEAAAKASEPMTGEELRRSARCGHDIKALAIQRALAGGELVEVKQRRNSQHWLLWTRKKALATGVEIVEANHG